MITSKEAPIGTDNNLVAAWSTQISTYFSLLTERVGDWSRVENESGRDFSIESFNGRIARINEANSEENLALFKDINSIWINFTLSGDEREYFSGMQNASRQFDILTGKATTSTNEEADYLTALSNEEYAYYYSKITDKTAITLDNDGKDRLNEANASHEKLLEAFNSGVTGNGWALRDDKRRDVFANDVTWDALRETIFNYGVSATIILKEKIDTDTSIAPRSEVDKDENEDGLKDNTKPTTHGPIVPPLPSFERNQQQTASNSNEEVNQNDHTANLDPVDKEALEGLKTSEYTLTSDGKHVKELRLNPTGNVRFPEIYLYPLGDTLEKLDISACMTQWGGFSKVRSPDPKAKSIGIEKFVKLETLNASDNGITWLYDSNFKISTLKRLNLSHNHFDIIPETIFGLQNLEVLDLSNNGLIALPRRGEIASMPHLRQLDLRGNPNLGSKARLYSAREEIINEFADKHQPITHLNEITVYPQKVVGQCWAYSMGMLFSSIINTHSTYKSTDALEKDEGTLKALYAVSDTQFPSDSENRSAGIKDIFNSFYEKKRSENNSGWASTTEAVDGIILMVDKLHELGKIDSKISRISIYSSDTAANYKSKPDGFAAHVGLSYLAYPNGMYASYEMGLALQLLKNSPLVISTRKKTGSLTARHALLLTDYDGYGTYTVLDQLGVGDMKSSFSADAIKDDIAEIISYNVEYAETGQ